MKNVSGRVGFGRWVRVVVFGAVLFMLLSAEVCVTNGDSTTMVWRSDGQWWIGIWCDGADPDEDPASDTSECGDLDSLNQRTVEISRMDPDGMLARLRCW